MSVDWERSDCPIGKHDVGSSVQDLEDQMEIKNATIDAMGLKILHVKAKLKKANSKNLDTRPCGKRAREAS